MKQQVSPAVVAVVVVVIVVIIAFFGYRLLGSPAGSRAGEKPPGMPPDVAAEFQKRLGGVTGPPPGTGGGPPGGVHLPGAAMGVPTGPPGAGR